MRGDEVRATYDRLAPTWHDTHDKPDIMRDAAETLKFWLLPRDRILDIGCATGRDTALWRSLGHECVGVDLSPEMVREARIRYPDARFEVGDLFHLDALGLDRFDAFWASASLVHLDKQDLPAALASLANAVTLAGVGFISFKEGEGELAQPDGRRQVLWRSNELFNALTEHRFRVMKRERIPDIFGRGTPWLYFYVQAING